jgi:hypothetical protein
MSVRSLPPIYTRLGGRELPVGWAWFRPEPQVGDTVRLHVASGRQDGWESFRVVGKRLRTAGTPLEVIDLDVEPIAH